MKLLDYFNGSHSNKQLPFINKYIWEPALNISTQVLNLIEQSNKLAYRIRHHAPGQDNPTKSHRSALRQLKSNSDIIDIKPADKGSAIVLMDEQQYLLEAYRQLHKSKHYT